MPERVGFGRTERNNLADISTAQRLHEAASQADILVLTPNGRGSAFFVDSSGYALTAGHVVQDNRTVLGVTNGSQAPIIFDVRAVDARNDLAVLQARTMPTGVTPLRLRDSLSLQPGSLLLAEGHPFRGLSAEGLPLVAYPSVPSIGQYNFHAWNSNYGSYRGNSDMRLSPGNSGGAILDRDGYAVGVASDGDGDGGRNSLFAGADKAAELLASVDGRFVVTHAPDGWAGSHWNMLRSYPVPMGLADAAGLAAVGYGGYRFGAVRPNLAGAGIAAIGAGLAFHDYQFYQGARNEREATKYLLAHIPDAGMILGGLGLLARAYRPAAAALVGVSVLGRVGLEFWPVRTELQVRT